MKYLSTALIFFSINASACIVPPSQFEVSEEFGFKYTEKPSKFDSSMREIQITAPISHKEQSFKHGVFTVFLGGEVLSKSGHSYINEQGVPEFYGLVSNDPSVSYELSFLYGGAGKCSAYEFTAKSSNTQP